MDEKGGVGVYSRFLVKELCDIDQKNTYILFYRSDTNIGTFANYNNVIERVVKAPNKAFWDQVAIPLACKKEKVEILLNPKFSVPIFSPCKTVMTLHGTAWFTHPQFYKRVDLMYVNFMMPVYCKRASAVVSISQLCTDNFYKIFNIHRGKITTVYFAPAKHFKRITNENLINKIKNKYNLPEKFILSLSGYDRGMRKNIDRLLEAYKIFHGKTTHKLVIGGKDCEKFKADYGITDNGFGKDIIFPGWIPQEELPVFYTLADLYLYPSNAEAFPIPITEALACGTPIVTSNVNGLVEIAGDAALFVNPENPDEIADAMKKVLTDRELQNLLSHKGLERAKFFNWEKCARENLKIIEKVMEM
jgi:glycosyltransferase involved in cell wall biosynthesis